MVQILSEKNLDISSCMINPKFSLTNFGQRKGEICLEVRKVLR